MKTGFQGYLCGDQEDVHIAGNWGNRFRVAKSGDDLDLRLGIESSDGGTQFPFVRLSKFNFRRTCKFLVGDDPLSRRLKIGLLVEDLFVN